MKKVLFSFIAVSGLVLTAMSVHAQTSTQPALKIGVFDIDEMVQQMPGYATVDSMVQIYQRDSLAAEYQFYNSEYHRLDSTYKADSAAGKPQTILNLEAQQKQQVGINIVYWQQIYQNKTDQKTAELAQPLYEQVINAYKKVLDAKKYTLILKPNAIERGTNPLVVDNLFIPVAKELKINLSPELGGGQDQTQQTPDQKSGTTKPKQ